MDNKNKEIIKPTDKIIKRAIKKPRKKKTHGAPNHDKAFKKGGPGGPGRPKMTKGQRHLNKLNRKYAKAKHCLLYTSPSPRD